MVLLNKFSSFRNILNWDICLQGFLLTSGRKYIGTTVIYVYCMLIISHTENIFK